ALMSADRATSATIDESIRRRFEQAWRDGEPPSIEDVLSAVDPSHHLATMEELVHIDLEMRWKKRPGNVDSVVQTRPTSPRLPLVEDYLARFPVLRQPAIIRRLAEQEYRVRQLAGERPNADDFRQRFPEMVLSGTSLGDTEPTSAAGAEAYPTIPGYEVV